MKPEDVVAAHRGGWNHLDLVRTHWGNLFAQIERREWPYIRWCGGAWFVAGILYERDANPPISDGAFDELSRYVLENFEACVKSGCDTLQRDDLVAGTAMNWKSFPRVYQEIATLYNYGHRMSDSDRKKQAKVAEERAQHRERVQSQIEDLGDLF